uniref:DUF4817 domain-containing protein n=1 Tax=Megaselia scalaris TaxID=36166 RepID=T1GNF0_MEGSC
MDAYSFEDYTEMVIIYGEAGRNSRQAARIFEERFGRKPDHKTILRVVSQLKEKGTFKKNREHNINEVVEEKVLDLVTENPEIKNVGEDISTVILQRDGVPVHFSRVMDGES